MMSHKDENPGPAALTISAQSVVTTVLPVLINRLIRPLRFDGLKD